MFRLSKMSDYAVVVLSELGREGAEAKRSAADLAAATGIAEPTVAKVLKLLGAAGLVTSQRGAQGGYRIARPLARTAIADVIIAVEGPIALTACVDGATGACEAESCCPVRGRWDPVNSAIRRALSEITLADMQCPAWVPGSVARPQALAVGD
ncbi:SUF system Fe-S cluster assembly regulator [Elioraea tepida]|jgi:FeS assembly SUF system regulator|uniref:SUF system Fe-S cluster assembly regulator n=1 Tax=Elioraea tepida TaxID=2843330 RepID=A0A975YJL5_9PROT|nr:SUF system Fe-S cluster assembly regulator [Elioraea tepida]